MEKVQSITNIGLYTDDGVPLPLAHTIDGFQEKVNNTDQCTIVSINPNDDFFKTHNLAIAQKKGQYVIEKSCNIKEWNLSKESNCRFDIPTPIITIEYTGKNNGKKRPQKTDVPIKNNIQADFTKLGLNPASYSDVSYYTFTKKWQQSLKRIPIDLQSWQTHYFHNFEKWKDHVGKKVPKSVSLLVHTLIDDPTIDPQNIKSYGMEVECERSFANENFINISQIDGSGQGIDLREIQTPIYENPRDMFKYLDQFDFTQHGGVECGCGSHMHISPNVEPPDRIYQWRTYRGLIGYFAPFFAGTDILYNEDFRFRRTIRAWADTPNLLDQRGLIYWNGAIKQWWITPHKTPQKDFTFEFRLNEGLAQSAVTAIRLMSRIADGFTAMKYVPKWAQETIDLGKKTIADRSVTHLNEIHSIITRDKPTAEILSKVLQLDIEPNTEVALTDLLKNITDLNEKNVYPLHDYEKYWINSIQSGETWSKIISRAYGQVKDSKRITRQYLSMFLSHPAKK